jgi:fatty acid desaturase
MIAFSAPVAVYKLSRPPRAARKPAPPRAQRAVRTARPKEICKMNVAVSAAPRRLFRGRHDALYHSLALGLTGAAWVGSFALMSSANVLTAVLGTLLCAQSMVLAAYLIHEAAHQTLFTSHRANHAVGEAMNFIAGSAYASFERILHMHIRHHVDRTDLTCFDFKGLMARRPAVRRTLQVLEWAYVPATEILMHLQVVCRPFIVSSQRGHLPRVAVMLVVRLGLLAGLWSLSPRAVLLYALAVFLQLHALNFFDAFHHTFDQRVVTPEQPVSLEGRDRAYEQANTYSNVISQRHPWLNVLVLNFGYHNAHHHRPSVAWWRLPALHRQTYGGEAASLMPLRELVVSWHRNRVKRVFAADYGAPCAGRSEPGVRRADDFVGAHGVSFLTVV